MLAKDQVEENGPALACDSTAIEPEQRDQHHLTTEQLFMAVTEVQELPRGYAFRLPKEPDILLKAAQFIKYERLCCPFFSFVIEVEPEGGPFWLKLTGSEEVKQFISDFFPPLK